MRQRRRVRCRGRDDHLDPAASEQARLHDGTNRWMVRWHPRVPESVEHRCVTEIGEKHEHFDQPYAVAADRGQRGVNPQVRHGYHDASRPRFSP